MITALKVAKIEAHVNSQKTASEGRENSLKLEIDLLRGQLMENTKRAELLAQAVAQAQGIPLPPVLDSTPT